MSDQRIPVPGSVLKRKEQERWSAAVDPQQSLSVTLVLKRGGDTAAIERDLLSGKYRAPSREDAEAAMSATPKEMDAVKSFVEQHGLTVTLANAAAHQVRVTGTAQQLSEAFGVKLGWFEDANGARHIGYEGAITLPADIAPLVTAVLGLDQRPIAQPHLFTQ